ncbi:hypothetical protein QOZ80_1BG0064250 [Eleusine coracana subsp. coracana]|nr:hypothetical protein QOZ80_1BG0064250 [Eleusine coracana subsp. coracana]
MEEVTTGRVPDWSGLQTDVLDCVLAALEIPDLISSGAVCRSWNQRYHVLSRRPQGPCLLYFSIDRGPDVATLHRLSPRTSLHYRVALSPTDPTSSFLQPRHVIGCSRGWLVAADHTTPKLRLEDAPGHGVRGGQVDMLREELNELKDLRGHALFIGFNESFLVAAKDFPGLTPDCVYLAHDETKAGMHRSTL